MGNIAVIRLRGTTGINRGIAETLSRLGLGRINTCLVVSESPELLGMLRKAKDYITWGRVDDAVLKMLLEKRGAQDGKRKIFRLAPARGGLGRRGIKASFTNSGALGNRGEGINELIRKMV